MGFITTLDTTTFINDHWTEDSNREIVCVHMGGCLDVPVPELIEDLIHLQSNIDSLIVSIDSGDIDPLISNIASINLLTVEVEELPDQGFLFFDNVQVMNSFEFPYVDIALLEFRANDFGLSYAEIKLRFKPQPNPISYWSNSLTIVFDILQSNSLPTVDDYNVTIDYHNSHIVELSNVVYGYQDNENNPLTYIVVDSVIGPGELVFQGTQVSVFPLIVTTDQILAGDLVYNDNSSIVISKTFIINFTPHDD